MNRKELENCLHLIGYWLNGDKTVIDKILKGETQIVKHFVEPFSKELNTNLLNKDTVEAKKDLIKYYVFEFWELQGFYKEYNETLFTGSLCNYTPVFYEHTNESGTVRKLNKFENYVVNSWILFEMLFNEIQICCIKYKIDFFKVCNELNFSTEYIDGGITLAFEEIQRKNLPPQQTETKTEQAQQTENDFTLSSIENWLFEFKDKMTETDYQTLVSALIQYINTGIFPTLSKPIQINGRPNKKLFGWALNRIFEAKGKGVEKQLLQFAKQNISLFTNVQFDENNILKSNLYKYFTTKTE